MRLPTDMWIFDGSAENGGVEAKALVSSSNARNWQIREMPWLLYLVPMLPPNIMDAVLS